MREQKDWNMKRADREFSLFIRNRDRRCMNPLCPNRVTDITALDCSHFWGRRYLISRFDPENCIALCRWCHAAWEDTKQGKYRDLMIRLLGQKRFRDLERRVEVYKYQNIPHITENQAIEKCREFLQSHAKIKQ